MISSPSAHFTTHTHTQGDNNNNGDDMGQTNSNSTSRDSESISIPDLIARIREIEEAINTIRSIARYIRETYVDSGEINTHGRLSLLSLVLFSKLLEQMHNEFEQDLTKVLERIATAVNSE